MKAITLQIQVRTIQVPNPWPRIRRALAKTFEAIGLAIHLLLISMGILAVLGLIISVIFPNAAGNAFAWAIYEMAQWARGMQ